VNEITDATFEEQVLRAGTPVVVDFWAPWCGPCKAVEPILEELSQAQGDRIVFAKVNVDESPVHAARYGVLSIPTTILFENGEAQETVIGARPRAYYEKAWARWLADS